jgi:hypothetical protein
MNVEGRGEIRKENEEHLVPSLTVNHPIRKMKVKSWKFVEMGGRYLLALLSIF